jgi:hypothetical protein
MFTTTQPRPGDGAVLLLYVVSQKWTDAGEKGRDGFKCFVVSEKYDFSAGGPLLTA